MIILDTLSESFTFSKTDTGGPRQTMVVNERFLLLSVDTIARWKDELMLIKKGRMGGQFVFRYEQ